MTSGTPLPDSSSLLDREAAARVGGLFERHGRMVYGVCRAMLRDVHEAEDATQQVFLSAYGALLAGGRIREPGGWLATIARNECRRRISAGMRSPLPVADEDLALLAAPVDEHARSAQVGDLRDALAALPERQREAVVLRYLYGLRYGEVATALGLSRPATEALLFRARRALRGRLQPVVGTVLVVPLALRDELALALPGFASGAGTSAAAVGVASGGILAKLSAGSLSAKAATAAVAVTTVGAAGSVESDRPVRDENARTPIVEVSSDRESGSGGSGSRPVHLGDGEGATTTQEGSGEEDSSGTGDGGEPSESERSGSSGGSGGDEPKTADDNGGGGSGDESTGESRSGSGSGSGSEIEPDPSETGSSGSESSGPSVDESASSASGSGSSGSSHEDSGSSGSGSGESPSADDS